MKTHYSLSKWLALLAFAGLSLSASTAFAQGTTAFTYQGQLRDGGTNANGAYTMIFALCDSASGGNQIGGMITNSATLANGLFTVNLDFGAGAFDGNARWLDITVQSGNDSETLAPRVQVLPAPYAICAATANTASNLNVNGGSVKLSQTIASFEPSLFFVGGSGLPALQIWDDAQAGTRGITALNVLAGSLVGASVTATNVTATNVFAGSLVGTSVTATNVTAANVFAGSFVGGSSFGDGGGLTNLNAIPNMQVFTANGTFIVPTNVTRIMVEAWGGGGGGGGGATGGPGSGAGGGGGGGGGGYSKGVFNVTPGASYTVCVGTGGSCLGDGEESSFGSLISATGGGAGGESDGVFGGAGGAGGTGVGGQLTFQGGSGLFGYDPRELEFANFAGGNGGGAFGSNGGNGASGEPSFDGWDGNNPGGGGGGGGACLGGGAGVGGVGSHGSCRCLLLKLKSVSSWPRQYSFQFYHCVTAIEKGGYESHFILGRLRYEFADWSVVRAGATQRAIFHRSQRRRQRRHDVQQQPPFSTGQHHRPTPRRRAQQPPLLHSRRLLDLAFAGHLRADEGRKRFPALVSNRTGENLHGAIRGFPDRFELARLAQRCGRRHHENGDEFRARGDAEVLPAH